MCCIFILTGDIGYLNTRYDVLFKEIQRILQKAITVFLTMPCVLPHILISSVAGLEARCWNCTH